ncbi:GMC oxidoreductase [Seonamhaeicola aphaedonensis]|uniref:Choline dehydrogenase-like flavoprotein n=1 Tax=Seonamhaeicola aphaedonensis TaxID=1461338 RepID=A0A3D9HL78_9FLAO|nr:GMC family oxidoreductase [Seonamhaeicola aphaedonensis]RED50249.1 choline dehydrogenase-like flavoprotein [Seonamhaeicola aphaedonensis]
MSIKDIIKKSGKYDAIVIGTGISGGWAAKELCENGLKTLVLERGRMVEHVLDYPTMNLDPWDMELRGEPTAKQKARQHKQHRVSSFLKNGSYHWFVDDIDHPYNEEKRFDWIRGYHVGGRSITWGKQSYRLSDLDFEANKKDGHGVDWPIRYKDLEPWYSYVERYIGVSGEALGLPQLPDSIFEPPMELNCVEQHLKEQMAQNHRRVLTIGRVAHITGDQPHEGRGKCQFRNRCRRGCPYGSYFSSNASTLPAAQRSGNMTLRPHSIAYEIVYNDNLKKATGVRIIDAKTKEKLEFDADIIFCCASAIASTSILMQSKSERFPNGLGNDSGELGHNLMDHHVGSGASGTIDGYSNKYYKGRRPNGIYIPRFRNLGDKETKQKSFLRGYGYQGGAGRHGITEHIKELGYGAEFKEEILKPGSWRMHLGGFGECLPYHDNKMTLNYNKLDQWGLPTVTFNAEWKENELNMRKDIVEQAVDMLTKAGFKNIEPFDRPVAPGVAIHEMGTARMGRNPETSILNEYNQIHSVQNVFVTDGACMTSAGCQNPSLTYMAITARAANYAAKVFKTKL